MTACSLFEQMQTYLQVAVMVGPFCRKGLSPKGEPCVQSAQESDRDRFITCTQIAASREVLPGRQDLPTSATAPNKRHLSPHDRRIVWHVLQSTQELLVE